MSTALQLRHHFGEGWAADLTLPVGWVRLRPADGGDLARLSGFGDLQLAGRYDFSALWGSGGYTPNLTFRLGLGLPTGTDQLRTVTGVPPNLLSIGQGVFSLTPRLDFTQFVHKSVALRAWAELSQPLTTTDTALAFGTRVGYGVGALAVVSSEVAVAANIDGRHIGQAEREGLGVLLNSGGHALAAELTVILRASELASFAVGGRLPFYQNVNGIQVAESYGLSAQMFFTFGGGEEDEHKHGEGHDHGDHGDEHDHGEHGDGHDHGDEHDHKSHGDKHDHGDEHDHGSHGAKHDHGDHGDAHDHTNHPPGHTETSSRAGVVEDLATGGDSFDSAGAAQKGKVTVVDFWAEWCAPCKIIDRELRVLAETHPDLLVRRVEVPTFESKVAVEHLEGVTGLPVVWIYDKAGVRTDALVGAKPEHVLTRVKAVLARSP